MVHEVSSETNKHIMDRLDSFEKKLETRLDNLTEVMLTVARIEERQLEHSKALERVWIKEREQDIQLNSLEDDMTEIKTTNNITSSFLYKFIYPVAVLITGGTGGYLISKVLS